MKLALALLASTSDFLRALTGETRCISPHHVRVPVAGSPGVHQVLAQVIDRLDVAARFAFDARVARSVAPPASLRRQPTTLPLPSTWEDRTLTIQESTEH